MDRELFASRFRSATEHARVFGQRFVIEELPERPCFHVVLNASYDGNPLHADEHVFPEDGSVENQLAIGRCSEHEVIELLWRDGLVPEWIDVSVVGRLVDATLIEVLCCGRFTANDELLYHVQGGMPPFHVLGPTLPNDHVEGTKFGVLLVHWTRESLKKFSTSDLRSGWQRQGDPKRS